MDESIAADSYGKRNLRNVGLKVLYNVALGREIEKLRYITMGRWYNQWLNMIKCNVVLLLL